MPDNTANNAYLVKFGAVDGVIVEKITHKACNLASQWRMFLYLYGGPKERVDTLNAASGQVARMLQGLLWDDTLLRIRQLTDPGKSRSNTRCLIPWFNGAILSQERKEALWDKFVTGAPRPRSPSELQYSDRKLRSRS